MLMAKCLANRSQSNVAKRQLSMTGAAVLGFDYVRNLATHYDTGFDVIYSCWHRLGYQW